MNPVILTLFGEEYAPEPKKPAAKSRARKGDPPAQVDEEGAEASISEASKRGAVPSSAAGSESAGQEIAAVSVEPVTQAPPWADETEEPAMKSGVNEAGPAQAEQPVEGALPAEATVPVEVPAAAVKTRKRAAKPKATPRKPRTLATIPAAEVLRGWKPEKQYYTIGEVARLFRVNTSHIRFWTNEFALKVRTTRKGDRLYTPAQIGEIRTIYHLVKERGFTLAGAKVRLKEEKSGIPEALSLKESLLNLRNELAAIRKQLD